MVRNLGEEALYLLISVFVNLILFTFLSGIFLIKVQDVPQIESLTVVVKQELGSRPKLIKSSPPKKKVSKAVKKKLKGTPPKPSAAAVSSAPQKGDVKVPVKEEVPDVSILAGLEEKIKRRVAQSGTRKRSVKKEIGSISAVVGKGGVKFHAGSRKIVNIPSPPELITREFPSVVKIKVWVSPSGKVIKSLIVQRSGDVKIDTALMRYVRSIKFEPIKFDEIQVGVISFTFRGG